MKYCGECASTEEEVAFMDYFRGQYKCSYCLNEDPDYWRHKYYTLEKRLQKCVEYLKKTNMALKNINNVLERYEVIFHDQYPEEYVAVLEAKEKYKDIIQNNTLDSFTDDLENKT